MRKKSGSNLVSFPCSLACSDGIKSSRACILAHSLIVVLIGDRHKNKISAFKGGRLNAQDHAAFLALLNKAGWEAETQAATGKWKIKPPDNFEKPSERTNDPEYWMWMTQDLEPINDAASAAAVQAFIVDSFKCEYSYNCFTFCCKC